ncbi:MAG: glycosyltransferase family 2 protein [Candidatus Limnocylindrus sp.]
MENPPPLHFLIPAYEGREALLKCLGSIYASRGVEARVLVIDDASADGTVEAVGRRFPQCRVLVNPENLGFAGTC